MTHTTESRDATLHAETSLRHACSRERGNLRSGFGTTLQTQYPHTKGSGRNLSGARTRPSAVVWGVRVWAALSSVGAESVWVELAWAVWVEELVWVGSVASVAKARHHLR